MTELSGIRAGVKHMRELRFCSRSGRQWFEKHGPQIDRTWSDFVTTGVEVERIESVGESFGNQVAAAARREAAHGR